MTPELVENFRTGVLDRLGPGFDVHHEVNPGLVILSITGFGHDGPDGGRAGYDRIAQGEAGLMSLTGPGPDDAATPGLGTNGERVANRDRLDELGVPAGKLRTLDEVYARDQTRSQGLLVEVDHETHGTLRLAGPLLRFFDGRRSEVTRRVHTAPPTLDGDGSAVLSWPAGDAR